MFLKASISIIIGSLVANFMPRTQNGFKLGLYITTILILICCIIIDTMLI